MAPVTTKQRSSPRIPLSDQAYALLLGKIIRLDLTPGSILSEKELMDELGIGRTPIRESMQRLANEGLVTHIPNRGMFVAEISAASVRNIYEFRALIEGHTARLAAIRATTKDLSLLERLHHELSDSTLGNRIDDYIGCDQQFHNALAVASGNTYLQSAVSEIFNLHLRLWFFISHKSNNWQSSADAHEIMTGAVVDAIRNRSPDKADKAITSYITRRHKEIIQLL